MATITIVQHKMTLKNVTHMLQHFRKKHGGLVLHIINTPHGVAVVSLSQDSHTPLMDISTINSAKALTRNALLCLRNPQHKQEVTTENVSELLKITLLEDVVCSGVIL